MKKILFTGARSGIASKVIDNIKDRYYIYVTVRDEKQLIRVKEKYKTYKNIECFKLDITDSKDLEKVKKLDIDILVNNASICYGGSLVDMNISKIKENYEVNVFKTLELTQFVLKNMISKNKGKIIFISSLAGVVPIKFIGSYSSTKSSIIKIAETLKKELELISDIKVSVIEPGFYHTGFNQVMFDNKDLSNYFYKVRDYINTEQKFITNFIEKKKLDSIVFKIINCIDSENPKFIYKAPISQVLLSKIYQIKL